MPLDEEFETRLTTRFSNHFGLIYPFTCAGMAFAGQTPDLAIAVCKAGGVGALGVGFMPPEQLRENIHAIRTETDKPFNVNFITCFENDAQIRVCAEEKIPIASFHWGHPAPEHIRILHDAGVSCWEQVGTVEDGRVAAGDGMEVIIPQGWEAGGHNYGGLGSMSLIPDMVDAVSDQAFVLASGGIGDGRAVAAALALGADGVWVGTRLLASSEAHIHAHHRALLLSATGADTVRSGVFGPEMPDFNPMRLYRNRVVNEYTERLNEVPKERDGLPIVGETIVHGSLHTKRKFDVMLPVPETSGDFEEMPLLMGQSVGQITDIRPAGDIVREMMSDAAAIVGRISFPHHT